MTSGTMMHDTKLPLWKWMLAIYMIVESKKGVSANQLKRTLEVSYRTAWYLCHRIRRALETPDREMKGAVELDCTYIGGKKTGMGAGNSPQFKAMLLGAIERDSKEIRVKMSDKSENTESAKTVGKFLRANISAKSFVYTDQGKGVRAAVKKHTGVSTFSVNHAANEWVRGDVHTNSVEGAWSLFQRSIVGAFHQISVKHLPAYLDEFEFRYNNRENPYIFRTAVLEVLKAENIEYKALVS
ncbi:MAG TPA: IS1595 family transposase [Phycisphaerales bacterium]|nr:IS1595 family transposase [Phycisphaerales bacterium]